MGMSKTFAISFGIKNTYRVNSILYGLRQIPLIKKLLPDSLYESRGLKVFAGVLSALWELLSVFLGKAVYLALIFAAAAGGIYKGDDPGRAMLHIYLILTFVGAFVNTYLFNPTRDKYYAIVLLRMDARQYALIQYGYKMLKLLLGLLVLFPIFGRLVGLPLWQCLLMAPGTAGAKALAAAFCLFRYEKNGTYPNENMLGKLQWAAILLLSAAAFILPAVGLMVPELFCVGLMGLFFLGGLAFTGKILRFQEYRAICQAMLSQMLSQMDQASGAAKKQTEKLISPEAGITSKKAGFEYLNELFIKRHQKILWRSSRRIALVCACVFLGLLCFVYAQPKVGEELGGRLLTFLPYFVYIMYFLNRGTGFTRALFMNCDHSLLTYSFYRRPKAILKLFSIRLREIVKINLLPAAVIGAGLSLLLYVTGGSRRPSDYLLIVVSILCMSVFFSVHYLTIYYLLQPYNAGTEMKSGTYGLICFATYLVCFCMMQVRIPLLFFSLACILFCVIYCAAACLLVYRLAPKTFKLRP